MTESALKDIENDSHGRPHQRIPQELLLEDEMDTDVMMVEGEFMILQSTIPKKPYKKLMKFKEDIQTLSSKIKHNSDRKSRREMEELDDQLDKLYEDRKGLLRTFTEAVTANRLKKMKRFGRPYLM